jgi:hypothetical protein
MPPIKFIFSGVEELIALSSSTFPKKQQIAVQQAYHSLRRDNAQNGYTYEQRFFSSQISALGRFLCQMVVDEFLLLAYFRIMKAEAIAER